MKENILMIVMGALFIGMGIVTFLGNIQFIHKYNRKKITAQTVKPYGRLMGVGTIIIGVALIITGILDLIFSREWTSFVALGGVVVGFIIMLYAQFKYNRGLF